MLSAITGQIPRHRQPTGGRISVVERNRVVNVARTTLCDRSPGTDTSNPDTGSSAPTPPTADTAAPLPASPLGHSTGRIVAHLGQLADLFGVDDPVALQVAGLITVAGHGVFGGDHIDHRAAPHRRLASVVRGARRAIRLTAITRQRATLGQARRSASARRCARVRESFAHTDAAISDEPLVERGCGRGGQATPHLRPFHRAAA